MKARRVYVMRARAESAESTRKRILDSAVEELWRRPVSQVHLEIVATRAQVSVQTVLRIFGSRSSLLESALEPLRERIILVREAAQPGDVGSTISALFDHYEEMGDFVIHNLAEEHDLPELQMWLKQGREVHRQSLQRQFAPQLRGRRDKKLVLDCLVVACDVYTWKVLRRDMGRSRKAAETCVLHMVRRILEGA